MGVKEVALAGLQSCHSSLRPSPQAMGPLSGVRYCVIGTDTDTVPHVTIMVMEGLAKFNGGEQS